MLGSFEALGVQLVDILRSRRPSGEPAALANDFDSANRIVGAGRCRQNARDLFASTL